MPPAWHAGAVVVPEHANRTWCACLLHRRHSRVPAETTAAPAARAVRDLTWEVFEPGLGPPGVQTVAAFLAEQCVGSLADLEFLELDWMVAALAPRGVPPMLLNKFLALGRRRADPGPAGESEAGKLGPEQPPRAGLLRTAD